MIGVRQVTQIFQVKVFVSRYQLFVPDSESVYQEVQKIIGHGAVIDETAYGTYLALFDFFFTCSTRSTLLIVSSIIISASLDILIQ